jgi:prolyl 4-hydroxylase
LSLPWQRIILWPKSSLARRRFGQFFQESPQPSPALQPIRIHNWSLQRIYSSPNIYIIDNFLSASDLQYLRSCIERMPFEASFVDDPTNTLSDAIFDDTHRTSTFVSFDKQQNAKIAAIELKAATLMGFFSTGCLEGLQLVRYTKGQFFGVHHDLGDYNEADGTVELPPKQECGIRCRRRLVTILCYVNEVEQGGNTEFPSLNDDLQVEPRAGRAVLWQNVLPNGLPDARTVHAGAPVEDGVKYALNIWLCEE